MVFSERKLLMNGKATGKQIRDLQTVERQDDKCINCKAPKPTYVCLEFRTFVCQECSDIHRGFGHKIAAIDHSEWSPEEFEEIEKWGNKAAAEDFLAFWNPSDFARPDKKDLDRLRDFIRKAYVIKCWQRQPDPKRAPRRPWCEVCAPKADACANSDVKPAENATVATAAAEQTSPEITSTSAATTAAATPVVPNPALALEATAVARPATAAEATAVAPSGPEAQVGGPALAVPVPGNPAPTATMPMVPVPMSVPGLVFLPKDSACFCPNHDSTEKRIKQEPAFRCCNGCKVTLQTNYSSFAYCPGCSAQRSLCMICGIPVGSKYGPDGMLRMDPDKSSANPEFSDGNQTDATSAGNTEGRCEVDFSSSDAESADAASALAAVAAAPAAAAPPAAAELPAEANGAGGELGGAGAPIAVAVSTTAPATPEPTAAFAPSQANTIQNLMDLDLVEAPGSSLPARAPSEAAMPQPGPAPADDWLGEAIGGSASSSSPATPGDPKPSQEAAATSQGESKAAPLADGCTKAAPEDLFAACFSAPVEAKPTRSEELLVTPKAQTALAPEPEPEAKFRDRQQQQHHHHHQQLQQPLQRLPQQELAATAAGSATGVPDRFAALGELAEPVPRLPQGQLTPSPFKHTGACSVPSTTSPMHGRSMLETSPAFMSPQRLDELPAEHLADLHAMVTRALQQRTQAGIGSSPVPQPAGRGTPSAHQVSTPGSAGALSWNTVPELPSQPLQFGDVLTAFHEKNPSWEDKHMPTAPKALDSSGSSDKEQPKDFDDLLAAFHKRNPIAGFNSSA